MKKKSYKHIKIKLGKKLFLIYFKSDCFFLALDSSRKPFGKPQGDDLSVIETTSDLSHTNQSPFLISTSIHPRKEKAHAPVMHDRIYTCHSRTKSTVNLSLSVRTTLPMSLQHVAFLSNTPTNHIPSLNLASTIIPISFFIYLQKIIVVK